jgi:hypothetical protein
MPKYIISWKGSVIIDADSPEEAREIFQTIDLDVDDEYQNVRVRRMDVSSEKET